MPIIQNSPILVYEQNNGTPIMARSSGPFYTPRGRSPGSGSGSGSGSFHTASSKRRHTKSRKQRKHKKRGTRKH
jgi:hypothetical protein